MIQNGLDKILEMNENPPGSLEEFQLKYKNVELQFFAVMLYGYSYDQNGKHEYCGYDSLDELLDVVIKELDEPKTLREILRETPPDEVDVW